MSASTTPFESAGTFAAFVALAEREIGCPIPRELRPEHLPWRRGPGPELWVAGDYPLMSSLFQDAVRSISAEAPDNHGLLGFFGHGANSYAFYLGFRISHAFVHLRLAYGGAYSDHDAQRRDIATRLDRVAELLRYADACAATATIVDAMGSGFIRVNRADGRIVEWPAESLDDAAAFSALLLDAGADPYSVRRQRPGP